MYDNPIFILVLGIATAVIADLISDWLHSWIHDNKNNK